MTRLREHTKLTPLLFKATTAMIKSLEAMSSMIRRYTATTVMISFMEVAKDWLQRKTLSLAKKFLAIMTRVAQMFQ